MTHSWLTWPADPMNPKMENQDHTKLTKDARERPQVVIDQYKALWGELLERADKPKADDVDRLHSCMMVLGKSYEDFDVAAGQASSRKGAGK